MRSTRHFVFSSLIAGVAFPFVATAAPHLYSLAECLDLADRNHPNLWAARARLSAVHAQLDEVTWTPYSQWSMSALGGVMPRVDGNAFYSASSVATLYSGFGQGWGPLFRTELNGVIPITTFGKIVNSKKAAEAQVRVVEWDVEKVRQQTRSDVRRAFFGLQMARDTRVVADEILSRIDTGIEAIKEKIDNGSATITEVDELRLEYYREEIVARSGELEKGKSSAMAALRFFTGVVDDFDVVNEPLARPNVPLKPIVAYLTAARLFRSDINMARAGVVARTALVKYNQAKYFPDLGIGLNASYAVAPSAGRQDNPWISDPYNRFGFAVALGVKWNFDFLANAARVAMAESQLEETRALERLALGGATTEVETAYATAVEAKAREESLDRAEKTARKWIASVQNSIELGSLTEQALTEPLRAYANVTVQHLIALMDLNNAMSALALASGWDGAAPK